MGHLAPITGTQAAAIVICAAAIVLLAVLLKWTCLRLLLRAFCRRNRAEAHKRPTAFHFKLALRLYRPRLNADDAALDEAELSLPGALVRVFVASASSSFAWTTRSVSIGAEGGAPTRQLLESLASPRGTMMLPNENEAEPDRRLISGVGTQPLLLRSDARGTVWVQVRGLPLLRKSTCRTNQQQAGSEQEESQPIPPPLFGLPMCSGVATRRRFL
ncbi:hypothetical protein T492DRAFT_970894, partial [Pavlovales sp. CCMP2436]